jgi:hypothetical protein
MLAEDALETGWDAFAADIWMVGVSMYTMLFERLPFWSDAGTIETEALIRGYSADSSLAGLDNYPVLAGILHPDPS